LKMPARRMKQKSRTMDRPCPSSWTGAHENFQVREYDAGASPPSSEPMRKWRTAGQASTNFEITLKLLHNLK
jgi:hypothetical protein